MAARAAATSPDVAEDVELAGELDTAVSLVVADGRITRIYAIRNPYKLARLNEETTLSR